MLKNYASLVFIFLFFLSNLYSQTTTIPDANFEKALIDSGIDSDGIINQSVATADVSGVLDLYIAWLFIADLTGIEDFTNLTELNCSGNQLTSLDLSQNTALEYLNCSENGLTNLNISQNTALQYLECWFNQLAGLDISQNIALQYLQCSKNTLIDLDVSQNTALTSLECRYNQLTSLDLRQNTALTSLDFSGNQLANIDVSQNTALTYLHCRDNQLTNLDVSQNAALINLECWFNQLTSLNAKNGNNSAITRFVASNNASLTCIEVDNEIDANAGTGFYGTWSKDATATFSENCAALSLNDEILAKSIILYPNPVTDILTIDSKIPLTKVEFYSILGNKVKEINSDFTSIKTNNLSNGVYVVRIFSDTGAVTKKLIKN